MRRKVAIGTSYGSLIAVEYQESLKGGGVRGVPGKLLRGGVRRRRENVFEF